MVSACEANWVASFCVFAVVNMTLDPSYPKQTGALL